MKNRKAIALILGIMMIFSAFSLAGCDFLSGLQNFAKMSENFDKAKQKIGTNYKIIYSITDNGTSYTGSFIRAGKSGFYGTNESASFFDNDEKKVYTIDVENKTYSSLAATEQEIGIYISTMESALFSYYVAASLMTLVGAKVTDSTVAGRACKKYAFEIDGDKADYYIDNEYFIMSKIEVVESGVTTRWELTSIKVSGVTKSEFISGFPSQYTLEGEDPGDPVGLPFTLNEVKETLGTNYSVSYNMVVSGSTISTTMKRDGNNFLMDGASTFIYGPSQKKYSINKTAKTYIESTVSDTNRLIDISLNERLALMAPYSLSDSFVGGGNATVAGKACKVYTSEDAVNYYIEIATGLCLRIGEDFTVTSYTIGGQSYATFLTGFPSTYTLEGGQTGGDPVEVTEVQEEIDAVMAAGIAAIGTNYSIIYECNSESDGIFVEEFKRVGNLFYYRDGKFADLCLDESFFYDINVVPKTYMRVDFDATNTAKKYADGRQVNIYEEFKSIPLMMYFGKLYKQAGVTVLGRECIKYHVKYNNPSQGNDQIFYIDAQTKILVQWEVIKNNVTTVPQKLTSAAYGSMTKENLLPGFPTGYTHE